MARPRTALADDVLDLLVALDSEGVPRAAIARQLRLSRHLVTTRLDELVGEASAPPARKSCVWPGCDRDPSVGKPVCYFHAKVAQGLIWA